MKAKWLICNLGKEMQIQKLAYAVQESSRDVEIISLKDAAAMYDEPPSDEKAIVVTSGSIWFNGAMKKIRPQWYGNFHNKDTFKCSTYYAYWGQHLVQRDYAFYPFAEILRRKDQIRADFGGTIKGNDTGIFVRPDSGDKDFVGEVVRDKDIEFWYNRTRDLYNATPELLCVVAKPVKILKEVRLVIGNKKVITGSIYKVGNHIYSVPLEEQEDKDEIIQYAESVLNDNPPPLPPVHVLDLAYIEKESDYEADPGWRIMEVGCYCCCGMYDCDRTKIAIGVSEAIEEAYIKGL